MRLQIRMDGSEVCDGKVDSNFSNSKLIVASHPIVDRGDIHESNRALIARPQMEIIIFPPHLEIFVKEPDSYEPLAPYQYR